MKDEKAPVPRSERRSPASGSRQGLLIVGHGTRDPEGRAEFLATARAIAAQSPGAIVEPCFLELAEPTIASAVGRLVERGADENLTVVPLLLFAAGHAKIDLPAAAAEAAAKYPKLQVRQAAPLGCHPALVELSKRRYLEAVKNLPGAADNETLLLVVGRGSRDASANAELARFARLRFEACAAGWLETCFAAMAEPSLERALPLVARLPFGRVAVQPHLLFRGELLSRIRQTVEGFAAEQRHMEWLIAPHLGPDRLVAEAALAAIQAANAG
ncbi:MAG TPA: sirohydrochlorin chelatase [Pirellulales bacterium]|jgi:sirohydrochlorin cobaltochelatase|nr:sirohydrochlorin chelatase [Pirellulales bacterium]